MTRAADILDALLARSPRKLLRDRRSGLPSGWAHWISSQPAVPRPFVCSELLAALPQPLPAATLRLPALSPWQAFRRLWWQDWDPAPYDQRWWRRIAALVSLALHLLFALFLLWVAFVRWLPPRPDAGEAGRVQVEFVGRGTPADTGGGAAAQDAAAAAQQAAAASAPRATATTAATQAKTAAAAPAASAAAAASTGQAATSPPPAPPEQPLQVTETAQPSSDFVLPPPSVREPTLTLREIAPPSVQVPERDVDVVTEIPTVAPLRPRELPVPRAPAPQLQVREREVPAPLPQVQVPMPQIRARDPAPTLRTPEAPQVRQIELPTPATAATPAPAAAAVQPEATASAASAQTPAQASTTAQGKAETRTPTGSGAAPPGSQASAPGSGPAAVAHDGGWATPQRGDDWGASARNRAGDAGAGASQRNGMFNADGSVRVPGGDGQGKAPPRGAPGSETDSWSRDQIANAGQWLKRPPYDYTPTSFDKYWLPNATLLEEWVRRGIKSVNIPIPGTSSSISCVISILQLGGGCGITDPNLNDQPAGARPPPAVPFKPGLQDDNGSVK
ncbi:hypothetical protein A6R71_04165 [Xanthomonas translucens pv. arrhenatheri]|uniref:Transmembrane repetitive protein n=1 Tax=Xanthomonas graminis pv. arrhenatheri LMG 727 TaxID=1195923 RepID=A0A0K2ZTU7_9XANT|nr:hypothetical protein [Xanthomonas translucens]OAX66439.1 hypothetical protein A6R71_04165 [Xanthomonas translucens pv. arrhenatheri]UKE76022.1 hypothetical protein KM317_10915 [Xanthomonas translucens pv. arrhenatheri]CTP89201.1 hypothetical protein XTALMG727_2633 [Xanthomonas translucens pv. arrhenatheri LMG 727]